MTTAMAGGLICALLGLLWLVQQSKATVVSVLIVAAIAVVIAFMPASQGGVG